MARAQNWNLGVTGINFPLRIISMLRHRTRLPAPPPIWRSEVSGFTLSISLGRYWQEVSEPKSKRVPVRLRHSIEKASAAKQRKVRKLAKKVGNADILTVQCIYIVIEPRMAIETKERPRYSEFISIQRQNFGWDRGETKTERGGNCSPSRVIKGTECCQRGIWRCYGGWWRCRRGQRRFAWWKFEQWGPDASC